jgi:hypothetical protein
MGRFRASCTLPVPQMWTRHGMGNSQSMDAMAFTSTYRDAPEVRYGRFTSSWRAVPSPDAGRLTESNLPHAWWPAFKTRFLTQPGVSSSAHLNDFPLS